MLIEDETKTTLIAIEMVITLEPFSDLKSFLRRKKRNKIYNSIPARYDSYAHQISFCEKVRRDPKNKRLLQVKCTNSNCRKWFTPNMKEISGRLQALRGQLTEGSELRFYCSNECKQSCSIYRRCTYPKGYINLDSGRDFLIQSEWSNLVKERDSYQCVKCNSKEDLEAHHIEGIEENPLMSADVDLGITLCNICHTEVHKDLGCRYYDLRKENLCK